MAIEVVERPFSAGRNSTYAEYYPALAATATTGQALRVSFTRKQVNGLRLTFMAKFPTLKLCMRTLPDGVYLWAETRPSKA